MTCRDESGTRGGIRDTQTERLPYERTREISRARLAISLRNCYMPACNNTLTFSTTRPVRPPCVHACADTRRRYQRHYHCHRRSSMIRSPCTPWSCLPARLYPTMHFKPLTRNYVSADFRIVNNIVQHRAVLPTRTTRFFNPLRAPHTLHARVQFGARRIFPFFFFFFFFLPPRRASVAGETR